MPDPRWDESQVERVLEWYEKDPGDALVGEEPLSDFPLGELRELFGVTDESEDPPMFYKYAVEAPHAERIQQAVEHRIDLDRFDYLIAAYQRMS